MPGSTMPAPPCGYSYTYLKQTRNLPKKFVLQQALHRSINFNRSLRQYHSSSSTITASQSRRKKIAAERPGPIYPLEQKQQKLNDSTRVVRTRKKCKGSPNANRSREEDY
ncbi:hypothetical protein BDW59DRAFT_14551 [Aspergillus cavernicola]|uniref:Uncharacterized protein n=1 Tax=Aspergillus cavernicola TaxID=176166 RepID=A0ABR4ISY2_9EURO